MGSRIEAYGKMYSQKAPYFAPDVESKPIPPPIGGWDAISPLSAMDPKFAVVLDNWVPRTGYVEIRGGYNAWAQGLGTNTTVESLMVYRPQGNAEKMFAATGGTIYDASSYAVPFASATGFSNNRFQYVNFTPANSSNYLYVVNGADSARAYDGTSWTTPAITGVNSNTFINVNAHKRRLWFIQSNTQTAYYLATDAIQGAASPFPLGSFLTKGGFLVAMATWTVDGGSGPDDMAVFISSKGQCIVYKGTDPSTANAWALVGVFDLPLPIGTRCFTKIGSDVAIITTQGLLPLSQALPFDPAGVRSVALTNRIQNAMLQAAQSGSALFGWEALTFTNQALLIMNVPVTQSTTQIQFVMNTLTGAWCSFSGWNANCFCIFNESLYFGDNKGNVNLAYTASLDLTKPIIANMQCAFNYFDDPGRGKQMSMIRPLIVSDGTIIPTIGIAVDFGTSLVVAPVSLLTPAGAVWDAATSLWDSATWSTGSITVNNWLSVTGLGTALSIVMQVNVAASTAATAASSVFDTGLFDSMVFDGNGSTTASGQNLLTLRLNSFESLMEFGGPI